VVRQPGPYSEGGVTGVETPPPQKSLHKNVTNIIMAVIGLVGIKRAPECIKNAPFRRRKCQKIDPPDHISGYGPDVNIDGGLLSD